MHREIRGKGKIYHCLLKIFFERNADAQTFTYIRKANDLIR